MSNKKDLKGYVRFDGSGRVVAGSLILRRRKPKVGRWQEVTTYECCDSGRNDMGVRPFDMQTVGAVDSSTACDQTAAVVVYYHNGAAQFPAAGDIVYTDAGATTLFAGTGAFHHSTSVAGQGVTYEITGAIVDSVTACAPN